MKLLRNERISASSLLTPRKSARLQLAENKNQLTSVAGLVPVIPGETLNIYLGKGGETGRDPQPGFVPGGWGGRIKESAGANGGGGGGSTAQFGAKEFERFRLCKV
jgi:hypothetical protein